MMQKIAHRSFDKSLPMSLLRAREAVMKKFIPFLRVNRLSPQQWRVMRALVDNGESNITELSKHCFLLKPSLSRIIQSLEARDIVSRNTDANDQRHSMVSLTAKGSALFENIVPLSEERYAHITEKFGYGKLELLYELLNELIEKLDESRQAESIDRT